MNTNICNICGNKCFKTNLGGSSVYFCKDKILCCMNCCSIYRKYLDIKMNQNLVTYILKKQIKLR